MALMSGCIGERTDSWGLINSRLSYFTLTLFFSLLVWKSKPCVGKMHFLAPQFANYWLLLQIQPNVLSISGCETEHKAGREQTFFFPFIQCTRFNGTEWKAS